MLEWVNGMTCFRLICEEFQRRDHTLVDLKTIFSLWNPDGLVKPEGFAEGEREKLFTEICLKRPSVFYQWFLESFPDPTGWFQARLAFARSAAVWSMVGYVVGLGDRHGENILVDLVSGNVMHVDFDCLFEKGLSLSWKELVPFRLTPNMIDALGVAGVDGLFSQACEASLQVIRENEPALFNVLESFTADPLVEWRSVRRKEGNNVDSTASVLDAMRVLENVRSKMRGLTPTSPVPLSVHGHVVQLIADATNKTNLGYMYVGWMPWL